MCAPNNLNDNLLTVPKTRKTVRFSELPESKQATVPVNASIPEKNVCQSQDPLQVPRLRRSDTASICPGSRRHEKLSSKLGQDKRALTKENATCRPEESPQRVRLLPSMSSQEREIARRRRQCQHQSKQNIGKISDRLQTFEKNVKKERSAEEKVAQEARQKMQARHFRRTSSNTLLAIAA